MAINRSQIRDFLLPGLAGIEGKYPQIPARYPEVFTIAESKMALERTAEARYTGLAQLKNEGAATTFDNAAGERFVYNAMHVSLGLGFAMTREALDDNLYKEQFNPQALGLLESFVQTIDIMAANILNTSSTYDSKIGGDGVSLISTAHPIDNGTWANTPTVALDFNESAVEFALNAIRYFPDQAGLLALSRGQKLVVPVNLQWAAERLLHSELRINTGNNDINAIVSAGALPGGYTVNEFLTSPYGWWVTTNVKGLVFYNRVPFEMDLQVDPTTGNLMVIGYQRFAASYRNPRAVWGTIPTA